METLELLKALYGCTSKKDVEELFLKDFKKCRSNKDLVKLHNKYLPYIWFGRAYNSIIKKYTELRSIIETASTSQSDDALEDVFIMGKTQIRKKPFYDGLYNVSIKKATKKQIEKKDTNLIEIDFKKIAKTVSELKSKIDNEDFKIARNQTMEQVKIYHLIIFLALVTGRRQVEVMKSLEIDYNKRRKQQVYFKGIVKKGKGTDDKEAGVILFIDPADAKKYLSMLRKLLDVSELSNTNINQKYSGVLTKALNRYTKDILGGNLTMHDLRSLYAEYAWETQSDGYINKGVFFDTVLNHKVFVTVASNYYKFKNKKQSEVINGNV